MNYYKSFFLLAIFFLLNISFTRSQIQYDNIRFKQLGFAEGLPHNTVNAITQDNQGYLWFGTRNGLCKYDGYSLKHYFHSDNDTTSLRHDFIFKLYTTNCGFPQMKGFVLIVISQKLSDHTILKAIKETTYPFLLHQPVFYWHVVAMEYSDTNHLKTYSYLTYLTIKTI